MYNLDQAREAGKIGGWKTPWPTSFLRELVMPEDIPTPRKVVYLLVEFVALGCVLTGVEELTKQHYRLGIGCLIAGAVFLLIGAAGLARTLPKQPAKDVPKDHPAKGKNVGLGDQIVTKTNSISVKFIKPVETGLLKIRVINQGDFPQRIHSVRLMLSDGKDRHERFERIRQFSPSDMSLPLLFGERARFDVEFVLSYGAFVSWGVRFFRAQVELEDETIIESDIEEVNTALQDLLSDEFKVPFVPGLSVQEGWSRQERIVGFVERYARIHGATVRFHQNLTLENMQHAEVLDLNDNIEVRDACGILDRKQIPHPFKESDFARDILTFFRRARDRNINLRSTQGIIEYSAYFDGLFGGDSPDSPQE